jgi:hypothetical protein
MIVLPYALVVSLVRATKHRSGDSGKGWCRPCGAVRVTDMVALAVILLIIGIILLFLGIFVHVASFLLWIGIILLIIGIIVGLFRLLRRSV